MGQRGFASWPRRDNQTEVWGGAVPAAHTRTECERPQKLLEQLRLSADTVHTAVTFNGNDLPISFIIHFAFVIGFGILMYVRVAQYYPRITLWQGGVAFRIRRLGGLPLVPASS